MRFFLLVTVGVICFFFCIGATAAFSASTNESDTSFIEVTLKQDGASADGAFFGGTGEQAVIMVPGMKYDKESWYFLAKHFQSLGISSLALDSGSTLQQAIHYIQNKGYKRISAIGGSMGGESVINFINDTDEDVFEKMLVLAPYGGDPIKNNKIQKLFVVGKKDFVVDYTDIKYLHKKSAEPKKLKIYTKTSAHAQELFDSSVSEELIKLITEFISN